MGNYLTDEQSPQTQIESTISSQFADIELIGTLLQYRQQGESFWERIGFGGSIITAPLLYNGALCFGACDKNFYALTMEGKEKWRFQTNGNIQSMAATNGKLIYFGSFDGNLYALDEYGGKAWAFATQGPVFGHPVCHGGVVYIGSSDNNMYCIDAQNGELRWKFNIHTPQGAPQLAYGRVYFGYEDGILYCLDLSGKLQWTFKTNARICAWPAGFGDEKIFFGCYNRNLYALEALTGRLVWKFPAQQTAYAPLFWEGRVYFGSEDFNAYCVDARTGKLVWKFPGKGTMGSKSTIAGGRYYVPSYDNNLYCLDAETGKLLWRFQTDGFIEAVRVYDGRAYFGSWDCHLYCVDAKTGRLIWKFRSSTGSPSKISPPPAKFIQPGQVIIRAGESTAVEDKYKEGRGEGGGRSVYTFKSTYTTKSRYGGVE